MTPLDVPASATGVRAAPASPSVRSRSSAFAALGSLLVCAVACGATGPTVRPPRSSPHDIRALQTGDSAQILVARDPYLSGTLLLGLDGVANMPGCGPVHLAGLDLDEIERTIADCLVHSGAYDARPNVAVSAVDRSGTVVLLVGADPVTRRPVSFEPGMTLIHAIAAGMAESPDRVVLRRRGQSFPIDVRAMLEGREADEPLERGDEIVVEAQLPVWSESDDSRSIGPPPTPADAGLEKAPCGDLLLDMAQLGASGMGAQHPRILRVAEAIEARCSDGAQTPSPIDCVALRAKQAELIASGKGEKHPSRIALDRLVKGCP